MANEKRHGLIDLDKTLQRLEKEIWWSESQKSAIRLFLYKSKKVDAVEVVRCKDCKWYQIREWEEDKPEYDCRKTHALLDVEPDDFCSYGERKDNG